MFRFHHIGVAVPSIAEALPAYQKMFGYELVAGPIDDPLQRVTVCFLRRVGLPDDPLLELISSPHKDAPIQRILAKGGGAYHVCYEVDDMDAAVAHLMSQATEASAGNFRRVH